MLADKEKERRDIFERIKLMIITVFLFFLPTYLPYFLPGSPEKQRRYGLSTSHSFLDSISLL